MSLLKGSKTEPYKGTAIVETERDAKVVDINLVPIFREMEAGSLASFKMIRTIVPSGVKKATWGKATFSDDFIRKEPGFTYFET